MLENLNQIVDIAKKKETVRIAVAAAADEAVLEALKISMEEDIVIPILVGDKAKIHQLNENIGLDLSNIEIIDEANPYLASKKAVQVVREGNASVLMKGLVSTGPLLKAVLDKEVGLRKGGTLSHIAFFDSPYYHKVLCVTDAAMNIAPEFEEKVAIVKNAVETYNRLGEPLPKVAVVGAVEGVNTKMETTLHAAMMTMMNKRKQIKGCIIDGPLALDNAVSKHAAEHKGIESDVAGDVDIIMCPNIDAGNILYKSLNFLGGASTAAVIMGAQVPIVLTSRSDSSKSKMLSIALAAAMD